MGSLLSLLSRLDTGGDCCSAAPRTSKQDLFVDFESSVPEGPEDWAVYNETEVLLTEAEIILAQLKNYKNGATKEIRAAIGGPSPENEAEAWKALQPLVLKLKSFFDFSKQLDVVVPRILEVLCAPNSDAGLSNDRHALVEHLDDHQALVKQFARILDFVLKFDECKMTTPAVQNDFSYYRRTVQRNRSSDVCLDHLPLDVANHMSLFFAHANPMLTALSDLVLKVVKNTENNLVVAGNVTEMLGVMAKVCQKMLDNPSLRSRLKFAETESFILRVMVATLILYDHVHPTGAFAKGSGVDIKGCVRVLRDEEKGDASEGLLNALRYTTRHLNDENTPKSVRALIFDETS